MKATAALSAMLVGENETALALLHNRADPGDTWVRMRALLRLRNFGRAIEVAESARFDKLADEEAIAIRALHIFLLARTGKIKEAFELLPIYESSVPASDPLGLLELIYIKAYLDYCNGDYATCIEKLRRILQATASIKDDRRRYSFQLDAYVMRAKAATLIGVIYASDARFSDMEQAHSDALLSAEQAEPRDRFLEALILANLSCGVGESYSPSAIRLLENRVQTFSWNAGLEEHRVYIKRHLRMASLIFRSDIDAGKIGGRSAPSFAFRLAECIDSLLLESWNSRDHFFTEFSFAKEFISRVNWEATDGEEFTSLNDIIPVLVPFDIELANEAKRRFDKKLSSLLPHFTTSGGIRDQASMRFTAGCLAKARGDWDDAMREFRATLNVWESCGIFWRGAIAALELYTLTREAELLEIPNMFILAHPGTSFSRRLRRAMDRAPEAERGNFVYLENPVA